MRTLSKISKVLLLLWINFNTCLVQITVPHLVFEGETIANHSYVDFATLEGGSYISCHSEIATCCNALNREAVWLYPNGEQIRRLSGDGLDLEYGTMVAEIGLVPTSLRVFEPFSGIYTCDAQIRESDPERNRIYVGLYQSGGKKILTRCSYNM